MLVDFRQSRVAKPYPEDLATRLTTLEFCYLPKLVLLLVSCTDHFRFSERGLGTRLVLLRHSGICVVVGLLILSTVL